MIIGIVVVIAIFIVCIVFILKNNYYENLDKATDAMLPFVNSCIRYRNNDGIIIDEKIAYRDRTEVEFYFEKCREAYFKDKDNYEHALKVVDAYEDLLYLAYETDGISPDIYMIGMDRAIMNFKNEGEYVGIVELDE